MKNRQYLLNAIADFEPRMMEAFIQSVSNIASEVKVQELVDYLKSGNIMAATALIETDPTQFIGLEDAVRDSFRAGFDATVGAMPTVKREGVPIVMRLSARNERAEQWLKSKSGNLIREISESTREVIRLHLTRGMEKGVNPRKVALELLGEKGKDGKRVGGIINLTRNQMESVYSYRDALESGDYNNALGRALRNKRYDRMLASGKKLTSAQIDDMVQSYRQNYTKHRATVIAQQETRVSMAEARREVFQQTIDKGYLQEQEILKFWITRRDSRVRDDHERIPGMNREGVPLNAPFNTPSGPVYDAPHGVGCRCYTDIRIKLK